MPREDWEKRKGLPILAPTVGDKKTLYLPEDLHLWEMIPVIEAVDADTYANNPELRGKKGRELRQLGNMFRNAGIYLAKRLPRITGEEENYLGELLANQFYGYGEALITRQKTDQIPIVEIAKNELTAEETEQVDRWLAGDDLYKSRRARAEVKIAAESSRKEEILEEERVKTLDQFFRTYHKAAANRMFLGDEPIDKVRVGYDIMTNKAVYGKPKPWELQVPAHTSFLDKIQTQLHQAIETPERELTASIFQRGMEFLKEKIGFGSIINEIAALQAKYDHGIDFSSKENYRAITLSYVLNTILRWQTGEEKLKSALGIEDMREQLALVRQSGDMDFIQATELSMSEQIQTVVAAYPYETGKNNVSDILANQTINCVGASMLAGSLLQEVGINYLVGDVPQHSVLFIVTSDGKVFWEDMTGSGSKESIEDGDFVSLSQKGKPVSVADIVNFSKSGQMEGLTAEFATEKYQDKIGRGVNELTINRPELGQRVQVLNNLGIWFYEQKMYSEAEACFKQILAVNKNDSSSHRYLGDLYREQGDSQSAKGEYQATISLNPKDSYAYRDLGQILAKEGNSQEAEISFREAIKIDPDYMENYNDLGLVLLKQGRIPQALNSFEYASNAINPFTSSVGFYYMGQTYERLGRIDEAKNSYNEILLIENAPEYIANHAWQRIQARREG